MSGVATAIVGSAIIGSVVSSKASGKALAAQERGAESSAAETRRATDKARSDLFKLFPAAQENAAAGFQGALDIFGQSLPAQVQSFQQGNVAAQQQLLAGLPQFQNAILGGNVDFSQLQPRQFQQPDLSFFRQQLPQFNDPHAQQAIIDAEQQKIAEHKIQMDLGEPLVSRLGSINGIFGGSNRFPR